MNGVAFSAGAIGAMSVTVPLELLLRVWAWREAFLLIVAATVAVSLVLWLWVPERRETRRGEPLADQLRGLGALLRDPAFLRVAVCVGASQCAAVALQTLWIATWLRDVAGWNPAEVARGLLAVNVSMIAGYLAFGRAADAWQRRGRSPLPLLAAGVALSSLSLGLLVAGVQSLWLWCLFVAAAPRWCSATRSSPAAYQGDGGPRQHRRQRTRLRRHVRRPVGHRRRAQPLAAGRGRLCRRGLPLGARHGVGGAARRPGLAVVRPAAAYDVK